MATNQRVLWEEIWRRTPNSKHFHLADGSKQAIIWLNDVHYEDENGNYQNIDTALHNEADFDLWDFPVTKHGVKEFRAAKDRAKADKKANKLNRDSYDFQALKVPFFAKIPRNWKRGYSIGKGADKLTFKPVGASPSKGYVTEGKDNEIVYQDAWNDVDVALVISERGIKETLTLKTSKAPTSFTFEITGNLADDLTAGTLKLQPAWLEDSIGTKRDITQTIRREQNGVFLDLMADLTGLTFPVTIDPTVVSITTLTQDAYIMSNNSSTNYGSATNLLIDYPSSSGPSCSAYFLFSISGLSGLTGAQITNAIFKVYANQAVDGYSSSTNFNWGPVAGPWTESGLTYANRPGFYADAYCSAGVPLPASIPNWQSLDITDTMKKWLNGTQANYGLGIGWAGGSYGGFVVNSKESGSNAPYLVVTYRPSPSAPTVTAPNGGETWNAQHAVTWSPSNNIGAWAVIDTGLTGSILTSATLDSSTTNNAQTFVATSSGNIVRVRLYCSSAPAGAQFDLKIYGTSGGMPAGSAYVTQRATIANAISSNTIVDVTLSSPLAVTSGTTYAISIEYVSGSIGLCVVTSSFYASGGRYYTGPSFSYSWQSDSSYDMAYEISIDPGGTQALLQYEIQLSTDNGVTYHDIVSLTSAGATSVTYDFSNEPQSNVCIVRIRAYDGASYGPWDVSDGVFTIEHNQAPTAPTNLSPDGGAAVDRVQVIRLSWQHNDPNAPDPQSQFDLQYSTDGTNWTTVSQVTTNQYYDVPANTFAHGSVLWKVRTYDQAGLSSPYSAQAIFLAGDKPANPTITAPIGTVAIARPTVQWSSVGQVSYQIQVLDAVSAVAWDSGEVVSTNKAQTIGIDLANNSNYTVQVRIKNSDGLWSDWATSAISVSYTPPAIPTITATPQTGYIEIAITNPVPQDTEPAVSSNDLYRRKSGETSWTRIATGISANGIYSDYATASGITYEYYVLAQGDSGTFADSETASSSITLTGVWLHDVADPAATVRRYQYDGDGRSMSWETDVVMLQFAGRTKPVAEFGETDDGRVRAQLLLNDEADFAALESLVYRKGTVCYRDGRGRKNFGIVKKLPIDDQIFGYTTSVEVFETDYKEEM